ncbi:hypothetical protein F5888DRAFT_365132 [Russula emetica]|nr:hypothetical protein F5888DRAFT_365132 [Russula emetica]
MKAPSNVPGAALPQVLQGSSDLLPSLHSSLVYAEARYLTRSDALQASPEEVALRYVCFPCRRSYAQPQGLRLHIRTVHNPNQCFLCEFKWARPYEYRNHLRKHPGVNPDSILGKPAGSRRRATIRTEHLPQQPSVSPPAVEQDQQNLAESQPNPSAPPSLAGARDTSVPPPAVSSVDYNSQPVYAEQIVTMDEHEYAHGSEVLDSTYPVAAAMLLSTEERAEPMNISVQDGQFGLVQSFFT